MVFFDQFSFSYYVRRIERNLVNDLLKSESILKYKSLYRLKNQMEVSELIGFFFPMEARFFKTNKTKQKILSVYKLSISYLQASDEKLKVKSKGQYVCLKNS